MRASLAVAAVVAAAAIGGPVWAQVVDPAPKLDERKISLNLKDAPLRSALEMVFRGAGLQYAIEPNVPNIPITLSVREVSARQALRLILRQASTAMPKGWSITVSRE